MKVTAKDCGHVFDTDFVKKEDATFCPTCAEWNPETVPSAEGAAEPGDVCTTCEEVVDKVEAIICPTCGKKVHPELDIEPVTEPTV
jgi:uncharacterized paraquat-inducible protein A